MVGVAVYVVSSTDNPVDVQVGSAARDAFNHKGELSPGTKRALFSPDGTALAVVTSEGIGIARRGAVDLVTESDTQAVDAAWMPDSKSLIVGEGPALVDRLTVLSLDGEVKGVARLDTPFSLGSGDGLTVDSRGVRAVAVSETRDAIGGLRHLDLVLVDLTTGHVTTLTQTPDDESWPVFVSDATVVFARSRPGAPAGVIELDLDSHQERRLSPTDEDARPVGVLRGRTPVYASGRPGRGVSVWAAPHPDHRVRMGRLAAGSVVYSVDSSGTRAVAATVSTAAGGERLTVLRAVTLQPPPPG